MWFSMSLSHCLDEHLILSRWCFHQPESRRLPEVKTPWRTTWICRMVVKKHFVVDLVRFWTLLLQLNLALPDWWPIATCNLLLFSLEHKYLIFLEGRKRGEKCLYAAAGSSHLSFFHFLSSYHKSWALKWNSFRLSGRSGDTEVYGWKFVYGYRS